MQYFKEADNICMEDIELVAREMAQGKIAVFPTETVYGIGTNVFDAKACKKIYEIKKRPNNKPLIVLISNLDMLKKIVDSVSEVEQKLIEAFWPGPLTIIFHKRQDGQIPDVVMGGKSDIGVRMTSGVIASLLIQKIGNPIVAPSANLSGMPSGTRVETIIQELGDKVDYILDCGDINDETTSTLVKVEGDVIHLLRKGKIKKEELEQIARVNID